MLLHFIKIIPGCFFILLTGCSSIVDSQSNRLNQMYQKTLQNHRTVMSSKFLSQNKSKQLINSFFTIDQDYRKYFMREILSNSLSDHHHIIIKKIELKKAEAIKRLIKINRGWFIQSIYGEETDRMLWLLIQHMDSDIAYQKYILNILKKLYPIGETSKQNYAYLYDRIAINEKRPQKYGTQFFLIKH